MTHCAHSRMRLLTDFGQILETQTRGGATSEHHFARRAPEGQGHAENNPNNLSNHAASQTLHKTVAKILSIRDLHCKADITSLLPRGEAGLGRFSDHVVIQPGVATNGAATVNRATVSTRSLAFRMMPHVVRSLPASSTPGKSIWDRRRRPE